MSLLVSSPPRESASHRATTCRGGRPAMSTTSGARENVSPKVRLLREGCTGCSVHGESVALRACRCLLIRQQGPPQRGVSRGDSGHATRSRQSRSWRRKVRVLDERGLHIPRRRTSRTRRLESGTNQNRNSTTEGASLRGVARDGSRLDGEPLRRTSRTRHRGGSRAQREGIGSRGDGHLLTAPAA